MKRRMAKPVNLAGNWLGNRRQEERMERVDYQWKYNFKWSDYVRTECVRRRLGVIHRKFVGTQAIVR